MTDRENLDHLLEAALAEDIGSGDVTTQAVLNNLQKSTAVIVAKQDGVFSGGHIAARVFNLLDKELQVSLFCDEGDDLARGDETMGINGRTASILSAERTALNFLGHLSGIATLSRSFADAVRPIPVSITDTRKTTPLWRHLEKQAVRAGGASNHRFGLFDMILIKENHIEAAGGIVQAVKKCRSYMSRLNRTLPVEVETRTLEDVNAALLAGVDRIMLDNMDVVTIRRAVELIAGRARVEASGGISLETIRAVAECGVDFISVGAVTHSAPAFDFSLLLRSV